MFGRRQQAEYKRAIILWQTMNKNQTSQMQEGRQVTEAKLSWTYSSEISMR